MLIRFTALDANRNPAWIDPAEVKAILPAQQQGCLLMFSGSDWQFPLADDAQSVATEINKAREQLKKGKK